MLFLAPKPADPQLHETSAPVNLHLWPPQAQLSHAQDPTQSRIYTRDLK